MYEKFINEQHSSACLSNLNKLRKENQLCDIILKVSDLSIPAHKNVLSACSPYFHAMFSGHFPESTQKDVVLHDLDAETIEIMVNYMYTGEIEINIENVQNLLLMSSFLQMAFVQEKCCEFLTNAMDPSNCLGIKKFAGENNCDQLQKDAEVFAIGYFHKVAEGDEFLQLDIDEFKRLLTSPKIYHHTDNIIFTGIIRWVEHDRTNRSQFLSDLLSFVHPVLVANDLVKSSEIVMNSTACSGWVSKTLDLIDNEWNVFFLDKIGKTGDLHRYALKTQTTTPLVEFPEKAFAVSLVGYKNSLWVQGGAIDRKSTTKNYCYNIYRNNWIELNPLIVARSHHRSCIINDLIYSVGGNGLGGPLSSVECYNLYTGKSIEVDSMFDERTSMGAVVYDNDLYVMGGENEDECLFTVERYDPRIGYWQTLADMNQVNSYCSSAIVSGSIYCSEGLGNSMERYDVKMNNWELIEFKTNREFYELFTIENVLYSISGMGIYEYCFVENEWSSVLEFPSPREWDTAVPLEMFIV